MLKSRHEMHRKQLPFLFRIGWGEDREAVKKVNRDM